MKYYKSDGNKADDHTKNEQSNEVLLSEQKLKGLGEEADKKAKSSEERIKKVGEERRKAEEVLEKNLKEKSKASREKIEQRGKNIEDKLGKVEKAGKKVAENSEKRRNEFGDKWRKKTETSEKNLKEKSKASREKIEQRGKNLNQKLEKVRKETEQQGKNLNQKLEKIREKTEQQGKNLNQKLEKIREKRQKAEKVLEKKQNEQSKVVREKTQQQGKNLNQKLKGLRSKIKEETATDDKIEELRKRVTESVGKYYSKEDVRKLEREYEKSQQEKIKQQREALEGGPFNVKKHNPPQKGSKEDVRKLEREYEKSQQEKIKQQREALEGGPFNVKKHNPPQKGSKNDALRLQQEDEKIQLDKVIRQKKALEVPRGFNVETYNPSSGDSDSRRTDGTRRSFNTSYVSVERLKFCSYNKKWKNRGSKSFVPIKQVQFWNRKKGDSGDGKGGGRTDSNSSRGSSNSPETTTSPIPTPETTTSPIPTPTPETSSSSSSSTPPVPDNTSYVPLQSIQFRTHNKKLRRYFGTGCSILYYLKDRVLIAADDGDPTYDTQVKTFNRLNLDQQLIRPLIYDNIGRSKQPWHAPQLPVYIRRGIPITLRRRWGAVAGGAGRMWGTVTGTTIFRVRGHSYTIAGFFSKQINLERTFNFNKTFTFRGRAYTLSRTCTMGGKFTIGEGLKFTGKLGVHTAGSMAYRFADDVMGDGVSDTGIGSIATSYTKLRDLRDFYKNAKCTARLTSSAARNTYRFGVSTARFGYTAGRAFVANPVASTRLLLRYSAHQVRALAALVKGLPKAAVLSVGKLAALLKALALKLAALISKLLIYGALLVLALALLLVIAAVILVAVNSFIMANEEIVVDYQEMIEQMDEEFREKIAAYENEPYDHIYVNYMNGNGVDTNWHQILALLSVIKEQDIDNSPEEQELVKEIYNNLNYIETSTSSHTHSRGDGSTYKHTVLDVNVYFSSVDDILGNYLTEEEEIEWYQRIVDNKEEQYPQY